MYSPSVLYKPLSAISAQFNIVGYVLGTGGTFEKLPIQKLVVDVVLAEHENAGLYTSYDPKLCSPAVAPTFQGLEPQSVAWEFVYAWTSTKNGTVVEFAECPRMLILSTYLQPDEENEIKSNSRIKARK